jgi:hypothetical protein
MIEIEIPIKTVSEANAREHWAIKAKRAKIQRKDAKAVVGGQLWKGRYKLPLAISFVRIGKSKLDSDNLQGSFKAIRDGVADALGINDGSDLITWDYKQEKGKEYAVRIKVEQL